MIQRILLAVAVALWLSQPAVVRAQLTYEEFKVFTKLLAEPDSKAARDKRLKLIGDAIEREAKPTGQPTSGMLVDLKRARIPVAEGVPFLVERLDHPATAVKVTALRMLAAYGPDAKATTPKLRQLMTADPQWYVRDSAMLALTKMEPNNAEIAAAILDRLDTAGTNNATKHAVFEALIAMAPIIPKSELPRLRKILDHPWTPYAVYSHELIGKMLALQRPGLEQLRKMESIDWRNLPDQGYAVFAAIASAGANAEFAAPLVLGVLDSAPPLYLECVAVDTLARTKAGNPQALTAFLTRVTAKDLHLRVKARNALHAIDVKEPAAARVLAGGLRHQDPGIGLEVALTLRRLAESGRMPPAALAEMRTPLFEVFAELDESMPPGNLDAYLMLLRRVGPVPAPVAERLVKLYQTEPYFKKQSVFGRLLRGKVLATLANVGMPESGRELVRAVLEKGPADPTDGGYAYAAAARAAAGLAQSEAFVPLILRGLAFKGKEQTHFFIDWSGAANKMTTVRLEVIRALGKIGKPAAEALPPLRALAEAKPATPGSLDLTVQQEARRAFNAISGETLPPLTGIFADGKKESLQFDERLHVKLTLKLRNPRPRDYLNRLEQATNLKFTMDDNIDPDTPAFGSLQVVQIVAWQAMRQLAAAPSIRGTWEDVGDGYRLVGQKKTAQEIASKAGKAPFPPFRDDSFDPMPDDPRLKKFLNVQLGQARVQDLLQVVRDATGVTLTIEKVDTDTPLFQGVNWQNTSAWAVLRRIAESPRVQGTWEKVGDGYRLRGSHVPRPIVAAAQPTATAAPAADASPTARPGAQISLYLGIGLFFTLVVGIGFALVLRR